jgi:hypothetical protein
VSIALNEYLGGRPGSNDPSWQGKTGRRAGEAHPVPKSLRPFSIARASTGLLPTGGAPGFRALSRADDPLDEPAAHRFTADEVDAGRHVAALRLAGRGFASAPTAGEGISE